MATARTARIDYQGGDSSYLTDTSKFQKAKYIIPVLSPQAGYIKSMNTEDIGNACSILGAGRKSKEDTIDFSAGMTLEEKTGDFVNKGDVLAYMHTNKENTIKEAESLFLSSLTFSQEKIEKPKLVFNIIR